MHPLIRLHLLPQHRDVVVRANQGIQRIDPVPRVPPSMRGLAGELAVDLLAGVHEHAGDTVRVDPGEELLGSSMTSLSVIGIR